MWQGVQGMRCSKLLAEGGIRHTIFELHKGPFDKIQIQSYGKVQKSLQKSARTRTRNTLFLFHLFV